MELELTPIVYRMLPVQVLAHRSGAILKRGSLETQVRGERALEVVHRILEQTRGTGATREELRGQFAETERAAVDYLLDQLLERRLLVPIEDHPRDGDEASNETSNETREGIFYWELGAQADAMRAQLRATRLVLVGVNEIARELLRILRRSGFEDIQVVDYPLFRNTSLLGADGALDAQAWGEAAPLTVEEWQEGASTDAIDCVIATSDHGGMHWMRHWNEVCVSNRLHFFPVVLQNMIGYVGPYVVPGETACFECLRARQNSHLHRPDEERAFELVAFEVQDIVGAHPAMSGAVAHVAAMELVKLFSRTLPFTQVASVIELNLVMPRLVSRKVLRIPNCMACRLLQEHAATSADRTETMPGNRE